MENARKAGVEKYITVKKADIKDFVNAEGTSVICNPPYGERMLEQQEARRIYTVMGKVFCADREHPCAIITPDEEFEDLFGKKADKVRKLYNGMIKCGLYSYFR